MTGWGLWLGLVLAAGAEPEVVALPVRAALAPDRVQLLERAQDVVARRELERRGFRYSSDRRPPCIDLSCPTLGEPDYVLVTTWTEQDADTGRACTLTVSLRRRRDNTEVGRGSGRAEPCDLDGARLLIESATARAAVGPRRPAATTAPLALTTLEDLDIPDLPDVPYYDVPTSTSTQPPLDEALRRYAQGRIVVFEDGDTLRFARNDVLLGECGLRQALGAPVPDRVHSFCHGNLWVWAYVGVPVGGALAAVSYPELEQGNLAGFVGFAMGLVGAVTSAALATAFMEFGTDPRDGRYATDTAVLIDLAEDGNTRLRRELGLSRTDLDLLELRQSASRATSSSTTASSATEAPSSRR